MSTVNRFNEVILLILSCVAIYLLAPSLDRQYGLFISAAYAMVNVIASRPRWVLGYIFKYMAYVLIAIGTYYFLFNEEPWDSVFHGGLYESSPWPLIICSLLMTFNGFLLLERPKARLAYLLITLGFQIPVAIYVGSDLFQSSFGHAAGVVGFDGHFSGSWQMWQFEWMMTYFLPVYFFSFRKY